MSSAKMIAYEIIKQRINECIYMPGIALSESELMRDLEIGRTPIREALNKLECEGLLKIYPKRGAFISDVSLKDVYDIYDMLAILEPEVARRIACSDNKESLQKLLNDYRSITTEEYNKEYAKIDLKLHHEWIQLCENHLLGDSLLALHTKNSRARLLSKIRHDRRIDDTRNEHIQILQAAIDCDAEKAAQLAKEHVQHGKSSALLF